MGKCKEVVKKYCNGKVLKTYNSCKDAANEIGIKTYDLSRKIKAHKLVNNYYYEYSDAASETAPISQNKLKCPYCDFHAKNYNGICKHVFKYKAHGNITKEQLLTDTKYNGIRPTCKCGCGKYTTIINTNGAHFAEYIQGHWNRINNNWGHNQKAKENSAKTRREQYRNGTRTQWNKGKTWKETYTEDEQKKLRCNLINKLQNRINNSKFNISSNLELNFIEKYIKPYTQDYKTQYYIPEIKQFCDIFIPESNTIIEINGSYWHCDRRIYVNGPINDIQKEKIIKDEIKYNFLNNNGYHLIVIWELDIKNNIDKVKKIIEQLFNTNII